MHSRDGAISGFQKSTARRKTLLLFTAVSPDVFVASGFLFFFALQIPSHSTPCETKTAPLFLTGVCFLFSVLRRGRWGRSRMRGRKKQKGVFKRIWNLACHT
ncbi:hypothetical protein BSKO_05820 [Bryopsis sp. KO-2023]|nr:hypothetical protein BSKO_05820 [Bryopsis sp. KO-2023]